MDDIRTKFIDLLAKLVQVIKLRPTQEFDPHIIRFGVKNGYPVFLVKPFQPCDDLLSSPVAVATNRSGDAQLVPLILSATDHHFHVLFAAPSPNRVPEVPVNISM